MSGYRNQGFADSFLKAWGFVDNMQRQDEEQAFRRERAGKEDERWEKSYGLQLNADGRAQRESDYQDGARLPAAEARGLAQAGAKDAMAGYDFNAQQRPMVLGALKYQEDTRQPVDEVREGQKIGLQGAKLGLDLTRSQIAANERKGMQGPGGMSFSIGPDGTITYSNDGGLAKPTVNKLEETILNSQSGLDRIRGVQRAFNPKYLTLQSQAAAGLAGVKDKLGIASKNDQALLGDFEKFRAKTVNNMNQYIKDMSGLAVTAAEEVRLTDVLPTMKDGPTAFKAKMDNAVNELSRVQARAYYTRRNGIDLGTIPLASMDAIIDDYGETVEQQIKQQNPDIDPKEAERIAHEQVKRAFGM